MRRTLTVQIDHIKLEYPGDNKKQCIVCETFGAVRPGEPCAVVTSIDGKRVSSFSKAAYMGSSCGCMDGLLNPLRLRRWIQVVVDD